MSLEEPATAPRKPQEPFAGRNPTCTACPLHKGVKTVCVFGEGPKTARIMLVGLGPGEREDELGRPFVGPAGEVLDEMIDVAGLVREEVYVTNAVKCRPPNNKPEPEYVSVCSGLYLEHEQTTIRPAIVVALGAIAAGALLDGLGGWSGRVGDYAGKGDPLLGLVSSVLITYHPSAWLRKKDKSIFDAVVADLKYAKLFAEAKQNAYQF